MPIYEYRCDACGAELEKIQKISDPPLRECPECGRETLVKLVSASSFRLKGSGWYETDFKTGRKKNGVGDTESAGGSGDKAAAAGGSSDKAAAAGEGGKSGADSKPAASTATGTPASK